MEKSWNSSWMFGCGGQSFAPIPPATDTRLEDLFRIHRKVSAALRPDSRYSCTATTTYVLTSPGLSIAPTLHLVASAAKDRSHSTGTSSAITHAGGSVTLSGGGTSADG